MKNSLFNIVICSVVVCVFACEKADIQKPSISSNGNIQNRNVPDDCADCPIDDCCCLIQMTEGSAQLDICGSSSPLVSTTQCSASAGSCMISGYLLTTNLDASGSPSTYHFCMAKGVPFSVQSNAIATARITCQVGAANPQIVTATFNTPGNKVYYTVNGACELISCL